MLAEGGINNKAVNEITECSKTIKEQLEHRITQVIKSQKLNPCLFIGSRTLYKVWKEFFPDCFSVDADVFRDAFESKYGDDLLTEQRRLKLFKLIKQDPNTETKPVTILQLHELVNLTDFISFSDCLSLFEIDRLDQCESAVKTENAKNYDFEMRAIEIQHLIENFNKTQNEAEAKFDPNEVGQKTILLQTKMEVTSNFNLLFILYLFGLKTVHPES